MSIDVNAAPAAPSGIAEHLRTLEPVDEAWVVTPPRGIWLAKVKRIGRAFRDPAVSVPAGLLVFILLLCFLGPTVLGLPGPNVESLEHILLPVGAKGHLLGTNSVGNDMFSRLLHGGQVSIVVGVGATAIGMAIGTALGMTAGYFGGFIEGAIMRLLDAFLAFPGLILALAIAAILGPSESHTIMAISFFGIAAYGRLSRSQTLGVRHRDFVIAARTSGSSSRKVIFGHILPNVLPPLLAYAMITVGIAMLVEAGLSFLGLGIRPPEPSWGNLIASGQSYLTQSPELVIEPSIALFLTVLSLNLLADSLRRRLAQDR
jgi:peptide/nickel transport system permease protein